MTITHRQDLQSRSGPRKTVSMLEKKNEGLQPRRSFLMLMMNLIFMHHTLPEHAEPAFKILFTIHFLNRKAESVIQQTNYKTIKNNARTNIQLSINKTL